MRVRANGNRVVIGAPWNDGIGTNSGHVRVYENINGTWNQIGQDIDGDIIDKLTGKAAVYFAGVISTINN